MQSLEKTEEKSGAHFFWTMAGIPSSLLALCQYNLLNISETYVGVLLYHLIKPMFYSDVVIPNESSVEMEKTFRAMRSKLSAVDMRILNRGRIENFLFSAQSVKVLNNL